MAARIRVGVIGCGLIAQAMHLPYLRELRDRFEIAALCDLSQELLARLGEEYGVATERRYRRWEELLEAPLDAVMVLTSGSHAPASIGASRRGLHVFVEKPMCFSAEEGRAMVDAARAAGTRLMVGYVKRYDPAYGRLLEELKATPGVRLAQITTLESPIPPYVQQYPLFKATDVPGETIERLRADDMERVEKAVGEVSELARWAYRNVLLDTLVHELNAIRGILGEPDSLDFVDLRRDGLTAVFTFGPIHCVLAWVDLPAIARYAMEFAFYSPERRLRLTYPSPFLRSMPTELILEGGETGGPRSWRTVETTSYEEAFKLELLELHDSIVSGREPRTSGEDGVRDIALCQRIVDHYEQRLARAAGAAG